MGKDIQRHVGDARWVCWKEEYISYNKSGEAVTFVVLENDNPIGQITILFSPNCSAVKNLPKLCDGKNIANLNAFRIEKKYEGQGHISTLVKIAEDFARQRGIKYLTIGSETKESRNLSIYLHFGYNEFITSCMENGDLILYYGKKIAD